MQLMHRSKKTLKSKCLQVKKSIKPNDPNNVFPFEL